jgi:hypothetical protein
MKQEYQSNATTNVHIRLDINKSNLTNLILANKFGISEPTVSKWENRENFKEKIFKENPLQFKNKVLSLKLVTQVIINNLVKLDIMLCALGKR